MNKRQIDELIAQYPLEPLIQPDTPPWISQYDTRSARINYALVRHCKPLVVVEFGARGGRCTHDILKGLEANGGPYTIKSYEIDDSLRLIAQKNLNDTFGGRAPVLGDDIMTAQDLPHGIDYLFVDNYHDKKTTKWVFDHLLPEYGKPNCLVHFHDMCLNKDYEIAEYPHGEVTYIVNLYRKGLLPLEKVYWTYEEGEERSSTWWTYKKPS